MIDTKSQNIEKFILSALKESLKTPNLEDSGDLISIKSVGIIGAGTMGGGIAMNFANVGLSVKIIETDDAKLKSGLKRVRENYQRSADRGRFPQEQVAERMNLICGSLSMDDLSSCDLIIEAAFEEITIKKTDFFTA